jgi:two-component system chemotaxis response regulator CheB
VDFIPKPKLDSPQGIHDYQDLILDKIKSASKAKIIKPQKFVDPVRPVSCKRPVLANTTLTQHLVAIGASTGGTEAILYVLQHLPAAMPPIVITQHMPAGFTRTFAERLNRLSRITVKEAEHGERLLPSYAYVAPGDHHLEIIKVGGSYKVKLTQDEKVSGHRPSVDVMFTALAQCAAPNISAMILTGMGKDGAEGMVALHQKGVTTFAQDEQSCVVFGMPREAIKCRAVDYVVELSQMPNKLINHLSSL